MHRYAMLHELTSKSSWYMQAFGLPMQIQDSANCVTGIRSSVLAVFCLIVARHETALNTWRCINVSAQKRTS